MTFDLSVVGSVAHPANVLFLPVGSDGDATFETLPFTMIDCVAMPA